MQCVYSQTNVSWKGTSGIRMCMHPAALKQLLWVRYLRLPILAAADSFRRGDPNRVCLISKKLRFDQLNENFLCDSFHILVKRVWPTQIYMRYLYLYFTLSLPFFTFIFTLSLSYPIFTLLYLYLALSLLTLSLPYSTFILPLSNSILYLNLVFTPTFIYAYLIYFMYNLNCRRNFDYPKPELLLLKLLK